MIEQNHCQEHSNIAATTLLVPFRGMMLTVITTQVLKLRRPHRNRSTRRHSLIVGRRLRFPVTFVAEQFHDNLRH